MQLNIQSVQERKADARKKIMLGGLFVKAQLDHFHPHDPATLYGMLLEAKNRMQADPTLTNKWRTLGQDIYTYQYNRIGFSIAWTASC